MSEPGDPNLRDQVAGTLGLNLVQVIGRNIREKEDPREALDAMVESLAGGLGCSSCAVLLYHRDLEELEVVSAFGENSLKGLRLPINRGVSSYVVRTGEAAIIPDVSEDPRYVKGTKVGRSEIAVPIVHAGRVLGVLDTESPRIGAFGPTDLALLETVASMAAVILHAMDLSQDRDRGRKEREFLQRKLDVLAAANRSVNAITDTRELLAEILRLAREMLRFERGAVLIYDPRTDDLVVEQIYGHGDLIGKRFPMGKGISGDAFRKGGPVLVSDVTKDPRYIAGAPGGKSEMAVPLKVGDLVIGVLDAESTSATFSHDDLDLFALFAEHVASAMSAARLRERLEEQNKSLNLRAGRMDVLNRAARTLTSRLDLNEVLSAILGLARESLHLSHCAVLLLEKDKGELVLKAQLGYDETSPVRIPLGSGITGHVAEAGVPVVVGDVANDPRYVQGLRGARSEMAVPLKVYGEVIGILDAESFTPNAFDNEDLDLFQNFAAHAAIAIHNASLFSSLEEANKTCSLSLSEMERINKSLEEHTLEISSTNEELERRVRQLMTLHEAGRAVTSMLDVDQVLDAILHMTQNIVKSSTSAIKLIDEETKELKVRVQAGRDPGQTHEESSLLAPLVIGNRTIGMFEIKRPEEAYSEEERRVLEIMAAQAAIAVENARLFDKTQKVYYQTLKALAQALEARDTSTRGHCERVAKYAAAVARRMGFDHPGIEEITNAALLHDIGKIGIRDEILLKTQKLTPDEEAEIRSHPVYGDKILSSLKFLGKVTETVRHHHERWDGTGYPSGLKGAQIPLASRILAACDSFDTITSDRPYRPARSWEEAVRELRAASGKQFDPDVVRTFLGVLGAE